MIVTYKIQTLRGPKTIPVEIQIRTLAMNFWATIEHSLQYKYKKNMPENLQKKLLNAANAIGDDRLQQQGQGRVVPDSFTHGTSAQRVKWLKKGLNSKDLSNGDTVIYTWDCDDALAQDRFKVTMTYTDVEETVDNLEEVDFFDPFDFIDVTFVGKDGEAEVELVEDDDEPMVDELYYDVDPIDNLSVGDIVTITVSYLMDEESFVEEFHAIPSVTEMEYEVEDLESDDGPSISGSSSSSPSGSSSSSTSTSTGSKGTVLPNSSDKLLTNSDVSGLSKADIQTAINEIYARHGYTFTNPSVLAKFKQYDWYKPTVAADRFSDSVFSVTEKKNVDFLKSKL